jgi:hypothetical protein
MMLTGHLRKSWVCISPLSFDVHMTNGYFQGLDTRADTTDTWSLGVTLLEVISRKNVCGDRNDADGWTDKIQLAIYTRLLGAMSKSMEASLREAQPGLFSLKSSPTFGLDKTEAVFLKDYMSERPLFDDVGVSVMLMPIDNANTFPLTATLSKT